MPSLEMLKKLLDEFTEKEAHTREEINVITEQIGELEKRIALSQDKLGKVAVDREKVRAMQARYSGGSTLTTGPLNVPTNSSAVEETTEPRPRPGRAPATAGGGIPPAPLNVRASSTRIPAMKPADAVSEPTATASASPFAGSAETYANIDPYAPQSGADAGADAAGAASGAAAAQTAPQTSSSGGFSPMDIFGTPAEETPAQPATNNFLFGGPSPSAPSAAPVVPSTPTAPATPPTTPAVPANPAAALDLFSTGLSQIDLSSTYAQQPQQDVGVQTSDSPFYKPIGAEALRPDPEITQPYTPIGDATVPPSQQLTAQPIDEDSQQDLDDEPDDTVKSINDALRGLFR